MSRREIADLPLPQSEQSERGLLGSLPAASLSFDPFVAIHGEVEASDFMDEGYGQLFAAMKQIHEAGKPISDPRVLLAELPKLRVPPSCCGFVFLRNLLGEQPHAGHLHHYALEVQRLSRKRRMIGAASRMISAAYDQASDPCVLARNLEGEIARINANTKSDVIGLDEAMQKIAATALDELNHPVRSATGWGLSCIDETVGLLMRGELIVIGADPGSGKTAFVTQIATHTASAGKRTFFASLEMQATELGERELCRAADVDSRRFRSGGLSREMIEQMKLIADNHGESPIRIWSPPSATISQIRGMAKHEHSKNPLSLVIVDYLQIVEAEPSERSENRATRVGNVCTGLRQLAKELSVPVIALSQLNRKDRKAGVPPTMANLRESGDIEAASNVIAFLHPTEERKQGRPVSTQFIVGKCRAGEIGGINLVFHPKETRFTEPNAPAQAPAEKLNSTLAAYSESLGPEF